VALTRSASFSYAEKKGSVFTHTCLGRATDEAGGRSVFIALEEGGIGQNKPVDQKGKTTINTTSTESRKRLQKGPTVTGKKGTLRYTRNGRRGSRPKDTEKIHGQSQKGRGRPKWPFIGTKQKKPNFCDQREPRPLRKIKIAKEEGKEIYRDYPIELTRSSRRVMRSHQNERGK